MTKEQIKDLISAKIAGQGNQVDSGGALAEILNAIVDNSGGGAFVLNINRDYHDLPGEFDTKDELLQALGVNSEDWDKFINADNAIIKAQYTITGDENTNYVNTFAVAYRDIYNGDKGSSGFYILMGTQAPPDTGVVMAIDGTIENGEESYSIILYEV